MSNILITGANGFIGSHLVRKFLEKGHQVNGLVRKSSDLSLLEGLDIELRYGDVSDLESLHHATRAIDILVHNAGLASDWGPLSLFRKINLEGTKNIAQAADKNGVKRMVQMSSVAVQGFDNPKARVESDPYNPVFNYSISKMEAEQWLMDYCTKTDMEIVAIRPGNVYGPQDHTFIEKYIEAMLSGKIAYVNGGKSKTCPTYVENLVEGVYLGSQVAAADGEAFNITDGLDINWREFTDTLADKMGVKRPTMSVPLWLGLPIAGLVENIYKLFRIKSAPLITKYRMYNGGTDYYFSIEKAKKVLGFDPAIGLNEAMDQTVAWYKQKYNLD